MDIRDATYETFADRVGETFRVRLGDGEDLVLELTEVSRRPDRDHLDVVFSLVFQGQSEGYLPQRLYDLEHADLGTLPIFLVPIGQGSGGFSYEAVFSRLKVSPDPES